MAPHLRHTATVTWVRPIADEGDVVRHGAKVGADGASFRLVHFAILALSIWCLLVREHHRGITPNNLGLDLLDDGAVNIGSKIQCLSINNEQTRQFLTVFNRSF